MGLGGLLGPDSIWRCHLTSIGNLVMEIRRSYGRLISTMGFPILVRWHLYIESGPWACVHWESSYHYTSPCLNVRVSGCEHDRLTLEVEGHLSISAAKSHSKFPDDYNSNAISRSFVTSRELVVLTSLFHQQHDMTVHLTQAEKFRKYPHPKKRF